MNGIVCIYFEGNESKVALFHKEENKLVLLKAESIDTSLAFAEKKTAVGKSNGNKSKETYSYDFVAQESAVFNRNYLQKLGEFFMGEDLGKYRFIPILAEPAIYFQKVSGEKEFADLNINNNGRIETTIDFVTLHDNSKLAVFPSGKSNYLETIDSLARMNNRRFFKIPAVKSAEISLADYVARKRSFTDKETSLILYIGKEYSKLIFLKGNRLLHIGSTLSVGKNSFNAHNVIVSKILLELEHGAISNIDNIIICGEDASDDLISVINETYPHAAVLIQGLESVEIKNIDSFSTENSFIIPAAVAEEYFAELEKKLSGINLLPNYIKEEQKLIHLGWNGILFLLLTIISASFFSYKTFSNVAEFKSKDAEISKIQLVLAQNQATVNKIKSYENKIKNVDQTKVVLNQLSSGTGILSTQLRKLSNFTNYRRNIWMSGVNMDVNKNLKLSGFTLSRPMVKELSDSYNGSVLQNILYEPLRDMRSFKYSIDAGNLLGGLTSEKEK
ncbi:MAG TPA: hypothetical protein VLM39_11950 [Ignavibacteriaceae bacterium]|nr:hypothetical protein [Ignavibacteriaceae bacterium]